jgi:hypothetical protein
MRHRRVWDEFEIGFWHPFGPYTGLTPEQVLKWKRGEVARFGWTLWSFAYSPTAATWLRGLSQVKGPVYVLCSHSCSARDPDMHHGTLLATHYRNLGTSEWLAMPDPNLMKVTNPFKRRGLALGFKVRAVLLVSNEVPPFTVEWYSKRDDLWRTDVVPTRGEYLIRRNTGTPLRRVSAVLQLEPPYLVELTRERQPAHAG